MTATATDDVVTVYRTLDSLNAHALAAQLVEAGVDAHVVGDFLSGAYGGVSGMMTQVEVWVPAAQREQAAPLVARWRGDDEPAPAGSKAGFRFSVMSLLVVLSLAAFYAGARPIPDSDAASLGVMAVIQVALWMAFIYFALWRRRRSRNPRPTPPATPFE